MKKQYGMTLIEIMIALAIGLFIIAATLTVYINTVKSSSNTLKSARLNHDLGMAMSLMTNDIRRAGYWGGAIIRADSKNNPFTTGAPFTSTTTPALTGLGTNIQILSAAAANSGGANCILYNYDADGDGVVDPEEYFGFKRSTATVNGVVVGRIQMRLTLGTATANNCTSGTWETITDDTVINVTDLKFSFTSLDYGSAPGTAIANDSPCVSLTSPTCLTATSRCYNSSASPSPTYTAASVYNVINCGTVAGGDNIAEKRVVNVRLTAGLIGADNAEVTKTLANTIKVRNNRIYTQPN